MTFITLFSDAHGFVATDQKVFSSDEIKEVECALRICTTLEDKLASLSESIKELEDDVRKRAHSQGIAEGRTEAALELAVTIRNLENEYKDAIGEMKSTSASLAVDIVRKIAGNIETEEWLLAQATQVAKDLIDEPSLGLRVHPSHIENVKNMLASRETTCISKVLIDEHLTTSDCILETSVGQLNIGLDTQLDAILAALLDEYVNRAECNV